MRLATYIQRSPHGIYYLRLVIPEALRATCAGRRELRRSLGTRDPATARRWAYGVAVLVRAWREEIKAMGTPDIGLLLERLQQARINRYDVEIEGIRLHADPTVPGDHEKLLEAIRELRQSPAALTALAVGSALANTGGLMLSAAVEEYLQQFAAHNHNPKTLAERRATLARFQLTVPEKPLAVVTREDVQRFKDACAEEDLKPRTVHKLLGIVHSFFVWAQRNGRYPAGQILPSGEVGRQSKRQLLRSSDKRMAFELHDLIRIFNPVPFREYNCKRPHWYWLPILALFTGARIEELCQLRLADIKQDESSGIIYLHVNDVGDNKKLKTPASVRKVPLHSQLKALGFLDYVNDVRAAGFDDGRLFPYLRPNKFDIFSDSASKHFGRYLREKLGIKDSRKVFHSFRHTVITELSERHVNDEIAFRLVGHELDRGTHGQYDHKRLSLRELWQGIECLSYVPTAIGEIRRLDLTALRYRPGDFNQLLQMLRGKFEQQTRVASVEH